MNRKVIEVSRQNYHLPLTLHSVLTIRSAFAGVIKALSNVLAIDV